MSEGPARSRKRQDGFAAVLKNTCLSGSDPVADAMLYGGRQDFQMVALSRVMC